MWKYGIARRGRSEDSERLEPLLGDAARRRDVVGVYCAEDWTNARGELKTDDEPPLGGEVSVAHGRERICGGLPFTVRVTSRGNGVLMQGACIYIHL